MSKNSMGRLPTAQADGPRKNEETKSGAVGNDLSVELLQNGFLHRSGLITVIVNKIYFLQSGQTGRGCHIGADRIAVGSSNAQFLRFLRQQPVDEHLGVLSVGSTLNDGGAADLISSLLGDDELQRIALLLDLEAIMSPGDGGDELTGSHRADDSFSG